MEFVLTQEAKTSVQADLENVCMENVQTCILLALLSAGTCQTSSEALFARLAVSMSEILHLNISSTHGSPILDETSHRVWWSLYILDRWCSSGLGLPRHMENPHCPDIAPLPIDELSFQGLRLSSVYEPAQKPGIFTHMVTLVHHFGPIQDLNRSMARGNMEPIEKCEAVKRIGQQLESWRQTLPEIMHMSIQNLYMHQQNHLGGHFIALHLAFHHFSALLYFNSLESKIDPYFGQDEHIAQCKSHASSFSSLLHLSHQMKDCEQNYPTVGHMTTVASAVLLHTLLLGEPEDIPKARQELNTNFEALVELRRYWPATESMINRLMTFQKICLLSTESHKLDGWMVRFLLEHSLGLESIRNIGKDDWLYNSTGTIPIQLTGQNDPWQITVTVKDVRGPVLWHGDRRSSQELSIYLSVPESLVGSSKGNETFVCAYVMRGLNETATNSTIADDSCNGILSDDCIEEFKDAPVPDGGRCPEVTTSEECGQRFILKQQNPLNFSSRRCTLDELPGVNLPENYKTFGGLPGGVPLPGDRELDNFDSYDLMVRQPIPMLFTVQSGNTSQSKTVCIAPTNVLQDSRIPESEFPSSAAISIHGGINAWILTGLVGVVMMLTGAF
ncbi:hypothetical protein FHETE_8746 [Fusarium heterosporum]|uniref:Xylanolytic transcriptional activator regulatory domain-containing protein n=1 Tax=Fusarium heterosporum TaxID=42747 RepID=A0A8H5SVT8_FUSHE|nr:hypothetical protein FHETE_8746 [Fusarium heterosporum]